VWISFDGLKAMKNLLSNMLPDIALLLTPKMVESIKNN